MKKMKAFLNAGRVRLNMRLKRESIRNYPVVAYIEPTLFCQLRCPACPTGLQSGLRPSTAIDISLFKRSIDEIGDYIFQLNMYNWGEPLLHRQTPEMIRYAKEKEIEIRMSTNLSLRLTDGYIERLVRSGLDTLIVSLDGMTEETYSKYRVRGEFQLVCENMRRIQEMKRRLGLATPNIVWQFLVFRHNEHEIESVRAAYREWGADTLVIAGAEMPSDRDDFEPSTIPEHNIYHPEHSYQKAITEYQNSGRTCSWLYGVFILNPSGTVSPCCATSSEQQDFSDYRGDFLDSWNSDKFRRARNLFTGRGERAPKAAPEAETFHTSSRLIAKGDSTMAPGDLICNDCPIPHRQSEAMQVINWETTKLLHACRTEKSVKSLLAYLLMGAPDGWALLKRLPRFALKRLHLER